MCTDVHFEDLRYSIKERVSGIPPSCTQRLNCLKTKVILNSVNGTFPSGKLTGIIGASGAGKTTLLNVLAGYLTDGVSGRIFFGGTLTNSSELRRSSIYLTQDILLQPFLTTRESLELVADLKLDCSEDTKQRMIQKLINTLGLGNFLTTRTEFLSGGERKRLAIALELLSNPSVIFLDEPTTGLDEVSMKTCVELLKTLSIEGKTIVCTIHQPSSSVLDLFDQLYVMDDGYCIYHGSPAALVPFLATATFHCPITYNPADYILEIVHNCKENRVLLSRNVDSGETHEQRSMCTSHVDGSFQIYNQRPPFKKQLAVLLCRSSLQTWRNKRTLILQFLNFTICGLLIGGTYFGMGQDAKHFFHVFCFCILVIVYVTASSCISAALTYPTEFRLLQSEVFNDWYCVNAYYTSLILQSLLIPTITAMIFSVIVYFMTYQPVEIERFLKFYLIVILTIYISESHGRAVATFFNVTYSAIAAPGTLLPLMSLGFYGFGYASQRSETMKIAMQFVFVRYSLVGVFAALYHQRERVECSEIYCHYTQPKGFLVDMGMVGVYEVQVAALLGFLMLYKCAMYVFLRIRLK